MREQFSKHEAVLHRLDIPLAPLVDAPDGPRQSRLGGTDPPVRIDQQDDEGLLHTVLHTLPCLTASARVVTVDGPRRAGDLRPGDVLPCSGEGPQVLRWVAHLHLRLLGASWAVEICQGVFGATDTVHLAPQTPLLFQGWRSDMLSGQPRILVRAADLINGITIRRRAAGARITLVAFLCDRPALLDCEGLLVRLPGLADAPLLPIKLPPTDPVLNRLGTPEEIGFATPEQARRLCAPLPVFF